MKIIKDNFNKIFNIFIIMQPFLDILTAIFVHHFNFGITPGIIVRLLFLMYIALAVLFIYKKSNALKIYGLFLIYIILYTIGIFIYKDSGYLIELQNLFRVFYFPILLISLYNIKDILKIKKNILVYTLILYIGLIFIPLLFNFGYETYEITKSGTLGFFNSANEISGIISILTPTLILYLKDKKWWISFIIMFAYLYVILNIGTKTPLFSLVITICFIIIWLILKFIKEKKYKSLFVIFITIILLFISSLIIIPKTNFYKNIETHMKFLNIDDISDLKDERVFDHFIFSERLKFLKNERKIDANGYQNLFGNGYTVDGDSTKMIEIDYFDIYYNHGMFGYVLFFGIYIYIFVRLFKIKRKHNFENYTLYISLFLIILLSLFTGHIITTPSVGIIVAILILSLDEKVIDD